MNSIFCFLGLMTVAAGAQTAPPRELTVWFSDGTGIEIRSLSTGANLPVSRGGSDVIPAGYDAHRVVMDKQGKILLGYDIEARKVGQGTFALRMKPVNRDQFKVFSWNVEENIPTIIGMREFPPLHVADAVEIDILIHPVTKERIYDVLRVLPERPPSPPVSKPAANQRAGERFSLEDFRVMSNGKTLREPMAGMRMSCGALLIHVPEHGDYYLTLAPSTGLAFQAAGWVDHNILRFHADSELLEIFSKANILQKSEYATVWVYRDPESAFRAAEVVRLRQRLAEALLHYKPSHPDVKAMENKLAAESGLNFTAGDSVEQLLALQNPRRN